MKRFILGLPLPLILAAMPAQAQEQTPPADDAAAITPTEADVQAAKDAQEDLSSGQPEGELLVVGARLRGQLETQQKPIAVYNEDDIQALGVGSIGELITRVSPQTGSGRGRNDGPPVIMVNGQRITNFREVANLPPEAIQRVEILPEETAQRYGYPPDSRVINLILKKKYRSFAIDERGSMPTNGGFVGGSVEASLTRISGPSRLSISGSFSASSPLFESERGDLISGSLRSTIAGDPDPSQFRTLIGQSRNYSLSAARTESIGKDGLDGTFTLSASINRSESRSLQGLNTVLLVAPSGASAIRTLPVPIEQKVDLTTIQGGAGYTRLIGGWQMNATLDFTRLDSNTVTDRRLDMSNLVIQASNGTLPIDGSLTIPPSSGQDTARFTSNRLENLVTFVGRPARLPAGPVTATFKGGFTLIGFESQNNRSLTGPVKLNRTRVLGGLNLAIPLTSRREGFLGGIGDVTVSLSGDLSNLSDFGAVNGWSAGLNWGVTSKLSLDATFVSTQAAPSISLLGNPVTVTQNVPVYDFARGETVLATVTGGGNSLLKKEQQRDWKFGLNWQLPVLDGSNLVVEYFRNTSDNVATGLPLLTPEIEAAFPDRATRDASGRLVAIDQRAVTFYQQESDRLRWGFNLSAPFGKAEGLGGPPPARPAPGAPPRSTAGAVPAGGPPRAGGQGGRRGGGGGGGLFGAPGGQPGRWSLGIYHTVQFNNQVLVTPGGPLLNLLDGDALSASGTPRHAVEFNGGVFYKGMGMFMQGTWASPTRLDASGAPGTSDLRFGSVTNVNMFLFVDFSARPRWVKDVPFLKGMRFGLRIENVFDSRQRVTDESGVVPVSYQPDYIDPRGRVIGFVLRKVF